MTVKIKWNRSALRKIRYGDADRRVISRLESDTEAMAAEATRQAQRNGFPNAKYAAGSRAGRRNPQGRHRTSVVTANAEAMLDNAKNQTLLKVMFGRG